LPARGEHDGYGLFCARLIPERAACSEVEMPSLIRFLTIVAVIGGLIYGGIFALATFFDPEPREITVTIPPDKFQKR
jgi:hypothetical protein